MVNSAQTALTHRVLVVDDHRQIREPLALYLRKHSFDVRTADCAEGMWQLLAQQRFDVILLDIMLPDADGFHLWSRLHARSQAPVILLTARDTTPDRVRGLDLGADDYVTKPFEPRELVARINSVLRRQARSDAIKAPENPDHLLRRSYEFAGLTFNSATGCMSLESGERFQISTAEALLLQVFLEHPHEVLNRNQLISLTVPIDNDVYDRTVDRQVSRLRRRLADCSGVGHLLRTVRRGGYMLATDVVVQPT